MEWAQARLDQHLVHSLCDRGAAGPLEARGIEPPVTECSVAPLSLDYPVGYGLGGHLEPHIGAHGPIPLTITEQGAARDQCTIGRTWGRWLQPVKADGKSPE